MGNDKLIIEYKSHLDAKDSKIIWVPTHPLRKWSDSVQSFTDKSYIYVNIQDNAIYAMFTTSFLHRHERIIGLYKYIDGLHYFALKDTPKLRELLIFDSPSRVKTRWEMI